VHVMQTKLRVFSPYGR